MKKNNPCIHIEKEGQFGVNVKISGYSDDLTEMLVALFIDHPRFRKDVEEAVWIAKEMLTLHERGEIDLPKMVKSIKREPTKQ